MNKFITTDINAFFGAAGCHALTDTPTDAVYWHPSIDVHFIYSPTSPVESFPGSSMSELVIVVATEDDTALDWGVDHEFIMLQDLPQFVLYRTFSPDCFDQRMAMQAYACATDKHDAAELEFSSAKEKIGQAHTALHAAQDTYKARAKTPHFFPVIFA